MLSIAACKSTKDQTDPQKLAEISNKYPEQEDHIQSREILLVHSQKKKTDIRLQEKFAIGIFNSGVVRLKLLSVDGEPYSLLTQTPEGEYLEFYAYNMSLSFLDKLETDFEYEIEWIETYVNLYPFDEGYQKSFVAVRVKR